MAAHTPGPWAVDPYRGSRSITVTAPDARFAGGRTLAVLAVGYDASSSYSTSLWTDFPDVEANALLIAAAPELADALELCRRALLNEAGDEAQVAYTAARDALVKAGRLP